MRGTAALIQVVRDRTAALRSLSFSELARQPASVPESFRLGWRQASLWVEIEPQTASTIRVIVQGRLQIPLLPVYNVALDGFYKHADGASNTMSEDELHDHE